jgi:2,4-diaminopentanoate dehydrogenase
MWTALRATSASSGNNPTDRPSDLAYRVKIEGDPYYAVELSFGTGGDTLSAMPVPNAIPAVCQAQPGLLGPLNVPRYWSRNVARG